MLWLVALAAVIVVASIARHAIQDHRDAELQRREALADIDRSPRAPRALLDAPDRELSRDVERDRTPAADRPADRSVSLPPDARTPTPPHGRARMI